MSTPKPLDPESVVAKLTCRFTGADPGPFAPPGGLTTKIDGVTTRIRIDPDNSIDVISWPFDGHTFHAQHVVHAREDL